MAKPTKVRKGGRRGAGGGGHGGIGTWFITFADVMGLLVAFFVMLVAFSTPGQGQADGGRGAPCARRSGSRTRFAIRASSNYPACRCGHGSRTPPISRPKRPR